MDRTTQRLIIVLALAFGVLTAVDAHAAEVCWQNPTANVDGSLIENLTGVRVYWGAESVMYSDSAFVESTTPGAEDCADLPIPAGTWFIAATATSESAYSNEVMRTVEAIPLTVSDTNRTAYTVVQSRDSIVLLPVGEVASGTECDPDQEVLGRYVVPVASVTWAGSVRSEVVFAECSGS